MGIGVTNGDGGALPGRQMNLDTSSWYFTGLGGSEGISAAATHGGLVGSPVVSVPFASSQVPESKPTLPVTAGDSSGMSDDLAVHESFLIPSHADSTGIGGGHAGGFRA
jgi:hypothetical protein